MKIKFLDPNSRITGKEGRSKLLDPNSELYLWLDDEYKRLKEKYGELVGSKRMDYHIEVIKRVETPTEELLVQRSQQLEDQDVDTSKIGKMWKAWVLYTPEIEGYGVTHSTIAFFPKGVPFQLVSPPLCETSPI